MTRDNTLSPQRSTVHLSNSTLWWLAMILICVVPFLSSMRIGTLSSFYLECGTLFAAAALTLLVAITQTGRVGWPAATVVLLLYAVFLAIQARVMRLPYVSQSDLTAAVFLVLALLAWSARAMVLRLGQERAVTVLAWALAIGALLQSAVCVLQFGGWTFLVPGVLSAPSPYYVYGQLAQRNHLGHYLMWGVLALCYLWQARRLPDWLALLLVFWLTGIMGLVGSRTIIAYVIAIGLSMILWFALAGKAAKRMLLILSLALALIVFFQITLSPLFSWLWNIDFQSATERLGSDSFAHSGRSMEWKKAWEIFLNAPLFGHGWGSYAYEGFAENIYEGGFRNYEGSVLFTHCHNIVLQLLAETGLFGTLTLFGGFLWSIRTLFRRGFHPASILLVSIMLVSLCHSMLEYPLWYVYFLAVFVLCAALAPPPERCQQSAAQPISFWVRPVLSFASFATLVVLMHTTVMYTELLGTRYETSNNLTPAQVEKFQNIRKQLYFLHYYVDMVLVSKVANAQSGSTAGAGTLPEWGFQAADLAGRYRPYFHLYIRTLYLARHGKTQEAEKFMSQMAHYYPELFGSYIRETRQSAPLLLGPLVQVCQQYRRQNSEAVCQ